MRIDEFIVGPAKSEHGTHVMHVEMGGYKFTGYFADLSGYLSATQEMIQFFALKQGKLKTSEQTLTRPVINT